MRPAAQSSDRALTLLEALVVIAVVAILAALLLPALVPVRRPPYRRKAQFEEMQIAQAIQAYESDYSKFPVSSNAVNAAAGSRQDFTFGTYGLPHGLKTPVGTYDVRALDAERNPLSYQANNSEVMAVLLDIESWPASPTVPTVNQGHVMNPQKTRYLNAAMSANTSSPGIGPDGVYRDPWGQPYIITVDLNGDGKARDAFYCAPGISADQSDTNAPKPGLNGLMPTVVGGRTIYEAKSPVMVWSAGADKMVDPGPGTSADQGANKDNVLSWK
jgi:type II secretory pathway pseudopilin PulG